jgi:hypothetical protein
VFAAQQCYEFGEGMVEEWDRGHWQAVADTQAALSEIIPTAVVIGNHAQMTKAMDLTNGSNWNGYVKTLRLFQRFSRLPQASQACLGK